MEKKAFIGGFGAIRRNLCSRSLGLCFDTDKTDISNIEALHCIID